MNQKLRIEISGEVLGDICEKLSAKNSLLAKNCQKATQLLKIGLNYYDATVKAQIGSSNDHTTSNQLLEKSLTLETIVNSEKDEVGSIWLPL